MMMTRGSPSSAGLGPLSGRRVRPGDMPPPQPQLQILDESVERKLLEMLRILAEAEDSLEGLRQRLAQLREFEPFGAFQQILEHAAEAAASDSVGVMELRNWMQSRRAPPLVSV